MEFRDIEQLLQEITAHRKARQLLGKEAGERFNIFKILGVQTDEVRTHSQFVAELLQPSGSHGMGDVFLKLWLDRFKIHDFESKNARVTVEHFIGKVTKTDGGRIDILLESGSKRICIENKIYAPDQPNQLLRYHRHDPSAHLFYLTLFGNKPSENSTGGGALAAEKVICISYENEVLRWLDDCRKEAAHVPNLRETLAQYIGLLRELTNQNFDGKMQTELVNRILDSPENLQSFLELQLLTKNVHDRLIEIWRPDLEKIAGEMNLQLHFNLVSGARWASFTFSGSPDAEALGVQIHFEFNVFPNGFLFGLPFLNPSKDKIPPQKLGVNYGTLKENFRKVFNGAASSAWWACYKYWDFQSPSELCADIVSGKINEKIRENIEKMVAVARQTRAEIEK